MIPAYHWVPKSAFPSVMEKGYLTPAIERLSPGFFRERCSGYLQDILRDPDLRPNSISVLAIEQLMEDRIEDLRQWSHGDFLEKEFSQLGCIDLMAGDHQSVFLQVGRWIDWGSDRKPTGFVFDAADLIREGGVLREKDLAPLYWAGLNKFLAKGWADVDDASAALVDVFDGIQKFHDLRGKTAIKALGKLGKRGASELLWNGRLPVSLAVESFHPDIYREA